ncbi:MAG: DUF3795 domain-containing protein [Promethearchaeota archaeon]
MDDPILHAPCGYHCGVCPYLMAYKDNDEKLKKKLAKSLGVKEGDIKCEGCISDNPFFYCQHCSLKKCVQKRGITSCVDCDEFPCKKVERFPAKEFIKKVKWDVNFQKQYGKEKWISKTIELNTCAECNTLNHWQAKVCKSCGYELKEKNY